MGTAGLRRGIARRSELKSPFPSPLQPPLPQAAPKLRLQSPGGVEQGGEGMWGCRGSEGDAGGSARPMRLFFTLSFSPQPHVSTHFRPHSPTAPLSHFAAGVHWSGCAGYTPALPSPASWSQHPEVALKHPAVLDSGFGANAPGI